jgi:hypothetical protein
MEPGATRCQSSGLNPKKGRRRQYGMRTSRSRVLIASYHVAHGGHQTFGMKMTTAEQGLAVSRHGLRNVTCFLLGLAFLSVAAFAQQSSSDQTIAAPPNTVGAQSSTQPVSAADSLFDLPPLPKATVTLVGGTVTHIDRVRNKLTVQVFGGKKMKFAFDDRTHIYRNGIETTQLGIRKGDRVYVDTQLDGTQVFARNIRVEDKTGPADASGQVLSYDAHNGKLVLRDQLSSTAVSFTTAKDTSFQGDATVADLVPGALVDLTFVPGARERGVVQKIHVIAKPGDRFTFAGNVTYLDVSRGILAIHNRTDNKSYEVRFDPTAPDAGALRVGSQATITAAFDGSGYSSRGISVQQAKAQ